VSDWKNSSLGEAINLKRGHDLPNRERVNGNVPIYSSSGITGFHNKKISNGPGVITGRYGTIGKVFYSPTEYWPLNTTLYVEDFKANNELFVYYLLQQLDWEKYSDKSAVPGVNRNDVHQEIIAIPSIEEQKAIASVLSSLDDKIDLLHRQNTTLERMAETLFRQWFVEEAQEDWEDVPLGNLFEISSGKGLKKEQLSDSGLYPVLGANGEIGRTNDYLFNEKLIFTGRVGTLGNIFRVNNEKVWLSDNTLIFRNIKYFYFVYFALNKAGLSDYNVGSTQPLIRQSDIKAIEFMMPKNHEKLIIFETEAELLFAKFNSNIKQIKTLEKLRDNLLPKLMSGEIRISLND
jgi:type I restriction enzyme, S subunit